MSTNIKMQAVMIAFNQAHSEKVEFILDYHKVRGYTWWTDVHGRGTETGEPRKGSHTWPEMNSALIAIVAEEITESLLESIKSLDQINAEVGIRAFVWDVAKTY